MYIYIYIILYISYIHEYLFIYKKEKEEFCKLQLLKTG